jgi:hypothetical protein
VSIHQSDDGKLNLPETLPSGGHAELPSASQRDYLA